MGSVVLQHLNSAWHVDQAIMSEERRLVVIRFGRDGDPECVEMDEMLSKIQGMVKFFAVIYVVNNQEVDGFNAMYELYDPCTVMFFHRNKHIMCDFGTGNNHKINFRIHDKQELIDIIECVYKGARKGKGQVNSPRDYSTSFKY
ncbi:thioredoxin-like protein 4A [Corynespora cassiicola Philippines]|uniref:Spliceosomal protein DIB1 n=1 Tax=Corynespora cassiicola Philippines TaxID=1448308 RepID=A0A2T2N9D4_CORCC|nr:thioredoxin-like protein 4A [Corynespora cassiicola Philippines]